MLKSFTKSSIAMLMALFLLPVGAKAQEAYAVAKEGTLTFYYDNNRSSRSGTTYSMPTTIDYAEWSNQYLGLDQYTTFVFDASFKDYTPTRINNLFHGCTMLTTIRGLENINLTNITDLSGLFYQCWALTSVDLSSLDTSKVTDMSDMFYQCKALTNIDLSSLDTSNVTDMSDLFLECRSLTNISLNGLDTSNVTNMSGMFRDCFSLTGINVSDFDTSNVTEMSDMFHGCDNLTSLDLSGFDTSKVTDMSGMFSTCSNLTSIDFSTFDTSNVTKMIAMFQECESLTTLDLSLFDTANVENMGWMFYSCTALKSLNLSSFDTSKVTNMYAMFAGCTSLTTIYCDNTWTCDGWSESMFNNCTALVGAVPYDASKTDVTMANPVDGYFTYVPEPEPPVAYAVSYEGTLTFYYDNLSENRLGTTYFIPNDYATPEWYKSGMDTKYVFDESFKDYTPTYIYRWFSGNTVLETIEGLEYLNTSAVTDMSELFYDCRALTSLDLTGLDTSNVTNMYGMFSGCKALTSLDLSGLDTSNVTDMAYMFTICSDLTSLDVSGFDTSNVTSMSSMFDQCSALTSLDLSGFDTSTVTDMSYMFNQCSALTSLDLTGFDTSKVTNMYAMFTTCYALTSLDLSGFDTSNVTNMNRMFSSCWELNTIYCDDTWTCDSSENMFYDCTDLVGAVPYDHSKVDVSMANPDTGYFTKTDASVTDINADESLAPAEIYNLQGIRMQAPLSDLPAGIYISGGRKVVLRR